MFDVNLREDASMRTDASVDFAVGFRNRIDVRRKLPSASRLMEA